MSDTLDEIEGFIGVVRTIKNSLVVSDAIPATSPEQIIVRLAGLERTIIGYDATVHIAPGLPLTGEYWSVLVAYDGELIGCEKTNRL